VYLPGRSQATRFIPAPAGNATRRTSQKLRRPVHPRACGERGLDCQIVETRAGSSPRLRGTLRKRPWRRPAGRFIPAPAGNALWPAQGPAAAAVHPRACGERASACRLSDRKSGSSPRLRGTLGQERVPMHVQRFIPAPAGNAPRRRASAVRGTVHPRACGERTSSTSMIFHGNRPASDSTRESACKCHSLNC